MPVLCLIQGVVLWRMAVVIGYVSERHTQLLVLCGVFWAVAGLREVPVRVLSFWRRRVHPGARVAEERRALIEWRLRMAQVVLLVALVGFGLPRALLPLHSNRLGHREAGRWLAERANPADLIVDPFCWAHYYSGRVFQEGATVPLPLGYQPRIYVIVENGPNRHERLPLMAEARKLQQQGTLVYRWLPTRTARKAEEVQVYCISPPP
jgi:hypothetical protein